MAALKLEQMIVGDMRGGVDELRAALLKYCEMDTLAMVELYRKLQEMATQEAA